MPPSAVLVVGLLAGLALELVLAQTVPSSWRQPDFTTSNADRINLAKGAIDQAVSQISTETGQFPDPGDTYGIAGVLLSQLAEFDLATNQSKYQDALLGLWPAAAATVAGLNAPNFTGSFINDGLNYGHGAAMAYKAYNNPSFLQYAEQSWWAATKYTISDADIKNGSMEVKNYTLSSQCVGITMAGGTFRAKDANDPTINALSTGGYLVVSALLAETTKQEIYLNAATKSLDFMHSHLYNVNNLVQDSISAPSNLSCSSSSLLVPQNSGLMLEGIAVLYSITGNSSLQDLAGNIVSAALSTTSWQAAEGIITPGDIFLPRGLYALYSRNAVSPKVKAYIGAYLAVQFNAVTTLGRASGSNIYGPFTGPTSIFYAGNQTNAIAALIAAIDTDTSVPASSSSASGSAPSQAASGSSNGTSTQKKSNTAAIAGGVVGGLVILAIVAAALFFCRQRRRSRESKEEFTMDTPDMDAYLTRRPAPTFRDQSTASFAGSSFAVNVEAAGSPLTEAPISSYGATPSLVSHSTSAGTGTTNSATPLRGSSTKARMLAAEGQPPASPPSDAGTSGPAQVEAQIPTDELVRMLYTRMNGQSARQEEAPPEYS